jgi:hypothetical protein
MASRLLFASIPVIDHFDRFICTLAVANTLYLAQTSLLQDKQVPLNNLTVPFWTDLFPDQQSFTVEEAVSRLGKVGDGFMDVARRYSVNGRMSEQIDRSAFLY